MENSKIVPLVTVLMPTYNSCDYIAETIDSVLNQTYRNFEFIIVDDFSTDGTREIIESFMAKDARIKLVDGEKKGIGGALHLGCMLAKGKYIARIDADDNCLPTRLAEEVAYLEKYPQIVLVNSDYYVTDEKNNRLGRNYPCSWNSVMVKMMMKYQNPIAHPTCMFRRDAYLKTDGYPMTPSHEDLILWRSLIKYGKFGTIKHPLIEHREIGTTLSRKYLGNPYESIMTAMINKIINDCGKVQEDIDAYKSIIKLANKHINEIEYEVEVTMGEHIDKCIGHFLPIKYKSDFIVFIKDLYLWLKLH